MSSDDEDGYRHQHDERKDDTDDTEARTITAARCVCRRVIVVWDDADGSDPVSSSDVPFSTATVSNAVG